jgi:fructose-bisphosphate aldolase class II
MKNDQLMHNASNQGIVIPAFNIPYIPMMEPVIRAARETDSFCFVAVARLEWVKFESRSMEAVAEEFFRLDPADNVRLHLDHIPVIDEDDMTVDYVEHIERAIRLGYQSVMIDGSRLPLEENIAATRAVTDIAHAAGIPVEAELGAVLGHEADQSMTYHEVLRTRTGFTKPEEAHRFVTEAKCDWLSVAFGNIHGAISGAMRHEKKVAAQLDADHLQTLREATGIPLVLHGGSGIPQEHIKRAVEHGIAKMNIGTEIRQAYEQALAGGGDVAAQEAVYDRTVYLLRDFLGVSGKKDAVVAGT